ncbi:membrane protein insertase YidC [Candidatus Ruthia endofausta]|uniref:Membrane protein insertase YidC n=1 Tax=Candidatus Ruthia endofausta TaxID=2738852 RepID=A0A6N0HQC3_9GAMM|nr:membrane protein insertase YidC [Candidatus Ruthia endofausta]QKQ24543.1 membrane protein insertase YidC [Candidatus Ruthia endofausta]
MNNQKFFLIIAIFLSVFLLWDKWEVTHVVDANGNLISQTKITGASTVSDSLTNQNLDVPNVTNRNTELDLPNTVAKNQGPFTTVTTDLLTLEISHKGGTIQNAWLNDYPIEINSEQKFQLLSDKTGEIFQAQSGLLPQGQMPTHHSTFSSKNSHYQMDGNSLIVPFTWQSENGIKVTKQYHFNKNSYVVGIDYQVTNTTNNTLNITGYTQLVRNALDQSNMMMPTYTGGARFDDQDVYEKIEFEDFGDQPKITSKGGWIAMIEHYFFVAAIPDENQTHTYSSKIINGEYLLTVVNPKLTIAPGATATLPSSNLYIGPKEQEQINTVAPGLDKTVDYGILFIIAKPLSELLNWIYSMIHSWGYSIIVLTLLIKLAFYKLSEKSYRSMAGMRQLAPRLTKLKETYGDDKQKLGQKTMELYKKEKINPASGCLPILVQIPVFISLYWVLLEMIELRQAPFWYLTDLSAQDPYYILPLIMGVSMFVQQKLNPPPPDPIQAKIMMALPFVFTIFFLWFPSGLVLYWVVNNILSITQQWVIDKRING